MNGEWTLPEEIRQLLDDTPNTDGMAERIRKDFEDSERDPGFVANFLKMQFVEDVLRVMSEKELKPAGLARLMGVERQYVTRVLNEKANFTFETLAKIACALDMGVAARLFARDEYMAILQRIPKPNLYELASFQAETGPVAGQPGEISDAGHLAA